MRKSQLMLLITIVCVFSLAISTIAFADGPTYFSGTTPSFYSASCNDCGRGLTNNNCPGGVEYNVNPLWFQTTDHPSYRPDTWGRPAARIGDRSYPANDPTYTNNRRYVPDYVQPLNRTVNCCGITSNSNTSCDRSVPTAPWLVNGHDGTTIQRFYYPSPICQNCIPYEDFRTVAQETQTTQAYVPRCTMLRNYINNFRNNSFSNVYDDISGTVTLREYLDCIYALYDFSEPEPQRSTYRFCIQQASITRAGCNQIRCEGVISPAALYRLVG